MDEPKERVAGLLHEAAETHHAVFRITDGADEDWATWYSNWLTTLSELPSLLGRPPVRSELTYALVGLDREVGARDGWEDAYAEELIRHFGVPSPDASAQDAG
jgi:hypothetical protein